MRTTLFFPTILAGLFAATCLVPPAPGAQNAPRRVEIVADHFEFIPSEITLKRGVPVVLIVTSKDVDHGLEFKQFNLNIRAKKGTTSQVRFTPDQTGAFLGQCSVFCGARHGAMKMTLHVIE